MVRQFDDTSRKAMPVSAIDHPAAWKTTDFAAKDDLVVELATRHVEALRAEVERCRPVLEDPAKVSPERFPLAAIGDDIAAWRAEVRSGRGILILRGIPVESLSPEDLRLMYLGLGSHFGRPVSQSNMGDLIGEVFDVGGKDRRERAYRNSRALALHTDRCDHLAMLCIRPAAEGGLSGYASALTIHNIMLAERPDLLEPLYRGYFLHRFGEQPPGEPPITVERVPIFSVTDGVPSVIYIRGYINLADEEGLVSLSDAEREALDVMDEVSSRPDVRLDLRLEPGEICLTNNCLLLHTRTAFEDAPDPARKRHLLRLWLREDGRPMASGVRLHKGRDGIEPLAGKGTYYTPPRGNRARPPSSGLQGDQTSAAAGLEGHSIRSVLMTGVRLSR